MSRLDIGRRVDEHVRPDTPALQGFAFARCCGFSSASIPHALTGKVGSGSRRFRPHAVAYDLWLPPAGSIRDLHPPPFIHARRTQSPYGLLPIPPRSLSLPTYSCVDPPPPSTLISRGEVSHRGWHRGVACRIQDLPRGGNKREPAYDTCSLIGQTGPATNSGIRCMRQQRSLSDDQVDVFTQSSSIGCFS